MQQTMNADKVQAFLGAVSDKGLEAAETGTPGILDDFRSSGLGGMLIPAGLGGLGMSALDAVQFVMRLGAIAPSAAIATVMHNFSVAGFVAAWKYGEDALEPLLRRIAGHRLLVSSGFAELGQGGKLTRPSMTATRDGEYWVLDGIKRPCSLSRSMDLMTASVWMVDGRQEVGYGVALVDAHASGVSRQPAWYNTVLAGSESDAVILKGVRIRGYEILRPEAALGSESAVLQVVGMNWFLVMITAAYVGMACQLVSELVAGKYANDRPANHTPGRLAASVRGCGVLIESLAAELDSASVEPAHMQQRLLDARAAVESVLKVLGAETPDCMNGAQFIGTSRLSYLREAISGLTFHPPSRDERFVSGGMEI